MLLVVCKPYQLLNGCWIGDDQSDCIYIYDALTFESRKVKIRKIKIVDAIINLRKVIFIFIFFDFFVWFVTVTRCYNFSIVFKIYCFFSAFKHVEETFMRFYKHKISALFQLYDSTYFVN